MAETMKHRGNNGVFNDSSEMSSYGGCVCAMLKLLAQFGKEMLWEAPLLQLIYCYICNSCRSANEDKPTVDEIRLPYFLAHHLRYPYLKVRGYLCLITFTIVVPKHVARTVCYLELKLNNAALRIEVNTDALDLSATPHAQVYTSLQQHITKLQAVSDRLKPLVNADGDASSKPDNTPDAAVTSSLITRQATELTDCCPLRTEAPESKAPADDIMVQIRAGKSEIERRISAFMERKQMEINENNVREFCNVIDCNQENSCARTDAVFTPYPGFKSHVKVTRVVNTYGPQTRGGGGHGAAGEQQRGLMTRDCGNAAIEERLQNIETHLRLPEAGPVPLNVYQRLKKLEDRILELEGLSPEYFQSTSHLHKRPKTSPAQACSLTELDEKISAVKAALLKRVNEFGSGYGTECPL